MRKWQRSALVYGGWGLAIFLLGTVARSGCEARRPPQVVVQDVKAELPANQPSAEKQTATPKPGGAEGGQPAATKPEVPDRPATADEARELLAFREKLSQLRPQVPTAEAKYTEFTKRSRLLVCDEARTALFRRFVEKQLKDRDLPRELLEFDASINNWTAAVDESLKKVAFDGFQFLGEPDEGRVEWDVMSGGLRVVDYLRYKGLVESLERRLSNLKIDPAKTARLKNLSDRLDAEIPKTFTKITCFNCKSANFFLPATNWSPTVQVFTCVSCGEQNAPQLPVRMQ